MIKFNPKTHQFEFYRLKATFEAHGEPTYKYDDTRDYWQKFINKWWHHTNLEFTEVVPTPEQQARLDELNAAGLTDDWLTTYMDYVEFGAVHSDTANEFLQSKAGTPEAIEGCKEKIRVVKRASLATHRYRIEVGGFELPNGLRIDTDRESQSLLSAAYQALSQPFVETIDWKGGNGWAEVDMATIEPLARACVRHVQSCFSAERRVEEAMDALETVEELEAFDVKAEFDARFIDLLSIE